MKYLKEYNEYLTKDFWKWFGNSKVVDEDGNPRIMYHGTTNTFDEFDGGAFFTDDYMNADGYAGGENVMCVYLSLQNPLIIDANGKNWDDLDNEYGTSTQEIVGSYDDKKYDGVIFQNIKDNWSGDVQWGDDSLIIFVNDSEKIKSAEYNNGKFDIKSKNINEKINTMNNIKISLLEYVNSTLLPKDLKYKNLLYHATDYESFERIMTSGELHGSSMYDWGIATSRNRDYAFGRHDDGENEFGDYYHNNGQVQFILDRDKINSKYKIQAFDWEEGKSIKGYTGKVMDFPQAEDKIMTSVIKDINKYIIGIQFIKDNIETPTILIDNIKKYDWVIYDKDWKNITNEI